MKRFVLRMIAFACAALAGYVIFLILIGRYAPESSKINLLYNVTREGYSDTHTRLEEAGRTKNVDILVLGSSHAYRGYDPRIFRAENIRIFNMGSSGQTPVQTEYLLDKYIASIHPRFVIFDVTPTVLENDGSGSAADLVQNMPIDASLMAMTVKVNNMRIYNSLAYSYYRQLFHLNKNVPPFTANDSDRYISGGFVETNKTRYTPNVSPRTRHIVLPGQLQAFDRVISKLNERKIPFILVFTPITSKNYLSFQDNDEIDSLFASRGKYYNFNKMMHLTDDLFADDEHLNQKGVDTFDRKLIEVMRENKNGF